MWEATKSSISEQVQQSDPDSFWNALLALQKKGSPCPPKSLFDKEYDFYHDCILRHVESNHALIVLDESGFVETWTYKKLHRTVNYLVKQWSKNALKPGQTVVIALPQGLHFTLALLTALRLGLVICYIPPSTPYLGTGHFQQLLDQVQPDWVIARRDLAIFHDSLIFLEELGEEENLPPDSFAYSAEQIMQLSIALHRQTPYAIVPLDAQTTYLHSLRDGLITLNLEPGICWASTFECPIRTQPCSTLMALLAGASILHVAEEAMLKDPLIIKNAKFHLAGISLALQKSLSEHPVLPSKQLKGYYKMPFIRSGEAWRTFVRQNKLEEVPSFHLFIDNSYGGSILFSKPSIEGPSPYLKPSLGLPWSLKMLNRNKEDSLNGYGLFSANLSIDENNQQVSNLCLLQSETNFLISSTQVPCREGITIPIKMIEEVVQGLPFVENCLLYCPPKMGEIANDLLILLIFTNPLENNIPEKMKQQWTEQLTGQLIQEVGALFVPDKVEYYPLMPPMNGKSIDRSRCMDQFNSGMLSKKRNNQTYQLISILKKLSLNS